MEAVWTNKKLCGPIRSIISACP